MNRFFGRGAALGFALLLTLPDPARGERPLSGDPQEEGKLTEELETLVRKLREDRAAYYSRHRARKEQLDSARSAERRLEPELAELRSREGDLERTLAEAKADLEKLKKEREKDSLRLLLIPEVEKSIREGKDWIGQGIPYRVDDRLLRLGDPAGGTLQDKLSRYWSFLQEEVRIARSGEALSMEVPLTRGRAKPARVFRVGHLILGYVTEDGLEAGLWNGKEWASSSTVQEEKAVRQAVDILDRRRAPELLSLPVFRRGNP
jgi:hypothetical protein